MEASSPALIERSRTVFTDGQGQYRVIALSPGTYKVSFTLTGFKTVVRDGIVLTAEFTANIDANMSVGGVEESTTTVNLIQPGTQYSDRLNQIDLRIAKSVKVGGGRIQGTISAFNLLNGNSPLTLNYQYGPSWLTPTGITQGRLVKFGVQIDY